METEKINEGLLSKLFEENFQRLRVENGHSLSEYVKESARQQVLLYWRKLKNIARSVTDTEVPLNLPNQSTEKKRRFSIEGVVDIVREGDKVIMYDIKTHDSDFVRSHIEMYKPQLNIYAYIWQKLKNEIVNETSVIATQPPARVVEALKTKNPEKIIKTLETWDPLIPIDYNVDEVTDTINSFSKVVDKIGDHHFRPRDASLLSERGVKGNTFATDVCRNCDARFSCKSYREYAKNHASTNWAKFADFYDFPTEELEINERVESYIDSETQMDDVLKDL